MNGSAAGRTTWQFTLAALLASVAAAVLLQVRLLPLGLPGQWEWRWRESAAVCWPLLVPLVLIFILLLAIVLYLLSTRMRLAATAVGVGLCCLAAGAGLVLMIMSEPIPPLHMASTTASVPTMGYLSFATLHPDPREMLSKYSHPRTGLVGAPGRIGTHPPGPALLFLYGRRAVLASPQVLTWLEERLQQDQLTAHVLYDYSKYFVVPGTTPHDLLAGLLVGTFVTLLGGLLPLPAYFVGSALGGRRSGLLAALLAATIPSLLIFVPSIDGVAAVLALKVLALWLITLRRRSLIFAALTGLTMAVAVFWTAGIALVAVAMVVIALPWRRSDVIPAEPELRRTGSIPDLGWKVGAASAAAAALAAVYVLLYAATGYNLIANLLYIPVAQRHEMALAARTYLPWLPLNLYDLVLFGGPALAALVASAAVRRRVVANEARQYLWGALATLLVVWLPGSTLGEVGRIWLFVMALLAVAPAPLLASLPEKHLNRTLTAAVAGQLLMAVALHCNLALVTPG